MYLRKEYFIDIIIFCKKRIQKSLFINSFSHSTFSNFPRVTDANKAFIRVRVEDEHRLFRNLQGRPCNWHDPFLLSGLTVYISNQSIKLYLSIWPPFQKELKKVKSPITSSLQPLPWRTKLSRSPISKFAIPEIPKNRHGKSIQQDCTVAMLNKNRESLIPGVGFEPVA